MLVVEGTSRMTGEGRDRRSFMRLSRIRPSNWTRSPWAHSSPYPDPSEGDGEGLNGSLRPAIVLCRPKAKGCVNLPEGREGFSREAP